MTSAVSSNRVEVIPTSAQSQGASAASYAVAESPAMPTTNASVLSWPKALYDERFARYRTTIETPYRRHLAGGDLPTSQDFEMMIDAAKAMRVELTRDGVSFSAEETTSAEQFLDQLIAEAGEQSRQ
jgi:hypothetical protein